MADATDSYSRWLDIPVEEQPPNHYRLLGVDLFNPDRAAIDAAAKRLMGTLQRSAVGEDAPAVRQLLTEIANARICLLTPQKRNDYDARLRSELNSANATAPASPARAQPGESPQDAASDEALNQDAHVWIEGEGSTVAAIPLDDEPEDVVPEPVSAPGPTAAAQPTPVAKPSKPATQPTASPKPATLAKPTAVKRAASTPAAMRAPKAPGAAKPKPTPAPVEEEMEFSPPAEQGSFFADLGLGNASGESGNNESANAPAETSWTSPTAGTKATAQGAALGAKASFKSLPKSTAGFTSKSKMSGAGGGQTKKEPFKLQTWHIGAMVGGGVLLLGAAVLIVTSLGGGSSGTHQAPKAPVDTGPPRFGPGSFTGTIDDITTFSPLGMRSAAQVPLDRQGDLFLTDVKINGQDAGKFLVDTGAFEVIVSTKVADRLKLPELGHASFQGPNGKQPSSERKIKSLGMGTVQFEDKMILPPRPKGDWTALAVDMKPWQDALKLPTLSGVIGCDILYQMPVSLNPLKKTLTFFNRHKFKLSDNQHPDFMSLIDNKPCMPASIDHGPANERQIYLLATGAPTGIMLPAPPGKIASLNLFGEDFANPTSETLKPGTTYATGDAREIGVIGNSILSNFELLLDFQNNKITATRLVPK